MAWTAPRTWTDTELVTASIMNTHIRDNQLAEGLHLEVRKSGDESDSSGVLQSDDNLLKALLANEVWQFRFNLLVVAAGSTDFQCRLTFPSGSISGLVSSATAGAPLITDISATTSPSGTASVPTTTTVSNHVIVEGVVSNGGTPGNLQLQWSGLVAATATVKANSTLWAVKLA